MAWSLCKGFRRFSEVLKHLRPKYLKLAGIQVSSMLRNLALQKDTRSHTKGLQCKKWHKSYNLIS